MAARRAGRAAAQEAAAKVRCCREVESTKANGRGRRAVRTVRLARGLHPRGQFGEDRSVAMSTAAETAPETPRPIGGAGVLAAGAMGAVVALALGLYGRAHDPQSDLAITLGFADTITMKVWLSSVAIL